jgi:hypothetical protein
MQLEVAREETVQILCQQFAQDRLSIAELESRLEQVYKAQSLAELYALTSGLAPVALTTTEATLYAMAEPGTAVRAERRIPVIFSETTLDGDWELARRTKVVAVFGAAVLDLREARIPDGVTELDVHATMAEVKIIVPPGIRVECHGHAFLGTFVAKRSGFAVDGEDAPTLRVSGHAFMGEVSIKTRLPNESALAALKRQWRR